MVEFLLQLHSLLLEGRPDHLLLKLKFVVDVALVLVYQALLVLNHGFELDDLLILLGPFLQRLLQGVSTGLQFLLGD